MNTSFGSLPPSGFGDLALRGDRAEGALGSYGAEGALGSYGADGALGSYGADGALGGPGADGALGRYGADGPLGLDAWRSTGDAAALHAQPSASARSLDDIERDFLAALCETRETRPA